MNPSLRRSGQAILAIALTCCRLDANAQFPAIPEPPVILHGTVTDGPTNQPVTITNVVWQVTDGTESATLNLTSAPPTRIVEQDGRTHYVLEVPFDTRVLKTASGQTVTLSRSGQSLELKSPSPSYTLTPFINGRAATIRSVGGVPSTGSSLPLTNDPASNGKMLQVDLTLPALDPYADWAATHFPNPNAPEAAKTADPDGDGSTNEQEYLAGTDPRNKASVLTFLASTWLPNGDLQLSIATTPGKTYRLLVSTDLGSFTPQGVPFTANDSTTVLNAGQAQRKFLKLEIVP